MVSQFRAAVLAALVVVASLASASAAEKAFQNETLEAAATAYSDTLREAAEGLSASVPALRLQAKAAIQQNDFERAMTLREQIAGLEWRTAQNWIDLSDVILNVRADDEEARNALMEKAGQAAYLGYTLATDANAEAAALAILSRASAARQEHRVALDALRLSLDLKESAPLRSQYVLMREKYGFRVLNFTVDSEPASPRACFQFSESLPDKGVDFAPYVAVAEIERPALSVEDRQLCVEGLKHGERYQITLREGLPSLVAETLEKAAPFNIYVRDRAPQVRFTSKAWVLPKVGQQGIPLVSVNTDKVAAEIFRIGDRNLIETVLGGDFQRTLYRWDLERLKEERGTQVWKGEMKVEFRLNQEVLTALPIDETAGELSPGIYALVAEPAPIKPDDYGEIATQWFIVSDLGLTALSGSDGIHAIVNSLATAAPKEGIEITLLSRGNEQLATATTNADGIAVFAPGLTRGIGGASPAMIVARDPAGDYAFLNLKQAAFDLSDRGVSGRAIPGPLDAFVVTERGVYRTGEMVHITALLRDSDALAASAPLTLVVERPDGVEHRRELLPDAGLGGRSLSMELPSGAMTGTWRVRAYADPKAAAIGDTAFLVEDYMPDRIEFSLDLGAEMIQPGGATEIALDGRYLYGAPAAGLSLEGEVTLKPVPSRPGYQGYEFGMQDEQPISEVQPLEELPDTDTDGKAVLSIALDKLPETSRPLEAKIAIRMAEPGGRAVERTVTLPVAPKAEMIGIKPLFQGRSLDDGAVASFDVAVVGPDGKESERKGLRWDLYKLETNYQWYRQNGSWYFEPVKLTRRVADGKINVAPGQPGRIAQSVTWGSYRLDVQEAENPALISAVEFDAGWQADATAETPDLLELALDKTEYKQGETLTASVTARSAGKLTLDIVSDRLLARKTVDVEAGEAQVEIPVGEDWGTGAYVLATLRRPLDAEAKRMPGRAVGAQWFAIDRAAHTLPLALSLPDKVRPGDSLTIPVSVDGLAEGEEARVVVAAVDVGILNLTNYKSPAPDDYYLGQRRLGAELRDLYGQLIDGMQATRGQIVTGGDGGVAQLSGSPPSQAPLALYSGIVTVGSDGKAEVAFDLPDFTGSVRVMAFAWSANQLGRAEGEVVVRDPVVLTASLPRFLTQGDESTLRVDLDNVEGEAGDYAVSITASGPASIGSDAPTSINLTEKARAGFNVPIATSGVGDVAISVAIAGPNNYSDERIFSLAIKPANALVARRSVHRLAEGQSLTLSKDVFAEMAPGTANLALSISPSAAIDPVALSAALQSYPFGCSEQITSEAIALLSLKQLARVSSTPRPDHPARIQTIIELLLARQGSDGSFGLWSAGGSDGWLDAYVTDFLTRAREDGFDVPDHAFRQAVDRVRNLVSIAPEPSADGGQALAYALYVLARNGAAPVGDLRYLADARLSDISTPIAKAQIAAALAMLGDKSRAATAYDAAVQSLEPDPALDLARKDYGSELRDAAAVLTLVAESDGAQGLVQQATLRIDQARARRQATSTQENAWLILAARALESQGEDATVNAAGETHKAPFHHALSEADLDVAPYVVSNASKETLQAVVTVSGRPSIPEPASSNGFTIERSFHNLEGEIVDPTTARQNERFVVVLTVTDLNPQYAHLAVTDRLPAGFEIDNPRLVSSGDTTSLDWILNGTAATHAEFRDDRFFAAFNREGTEPANFSVAYVVRAVSPGRYILPQAAVEDMYRPERFARTESGAIEVLAAQ